MTNNALRTYGPLSGSLSNSMSLFLQHYIARHCESCSLVAGREHYVYTGMFRTVHVVQYFRRIISLSAGQQQCSPARPLTRYSCRSSASSSSFFLSFRYGPLKVEPEMAAESAWKRQRTTKRQKGRRRLISVERVVIFRHQFLHSECDPACVYSLLQKRFDDFQLPVKCCKKRSFLPNAISNAPEDEAPPRDSPSSSALRAVRPSRSAVTSFPPERTQQGRVGKTEGSYTIVGGGEGDDSEPLQALGGGFLLLGARARWARFSRSLWAGRPVGLQDSVAAGQF